MTNSKSNRSRRWLTRAAVAAVGVAGLTSVAGAATTVYSDVTTFGGQAFANGASTAVGTAPAVDFTPLIADDITPAAGNAGAPITSISFSLVNFNSAAVSVNPGLRFYAADGTGGGPGTLLAAVNVSPIQQAGGTIQIYTLTSASPAGYFALPATTFWAGETFSDGGTATATPAQLANFGQGLFDAPTVGSSQDVFFDSSTTSNFTTSNPPGSFSFFGGNPVANFGWAFGVTPVPEPASVGVAAVIAGLVGLRRRRATIA